MQIEKNAFKGGTWLAIFKLVSQTISWCVTIFIARMLVPGDYGLVALAIMIVGLGLMFSEFGIGAAIIQKPKLLDRDLSSVFWFVFSVGITFTILCFFSSYLLAYIFHEPRIIPLAKLASIIFILSSINILPLNILKKNLEFKRIGLIEVKATIISNFLIIIIAYLGAGVWTLILGPILLSASYTILLYTGLRWFPKFEFNFESAKSFITFGANVAIGRMFYYLFEKSDKFFAGMIWSTQILGYYSFALQLAIIPTEKIVVLINQVSFSVLSTLQDNKERFNRFYLNLIKVTANIVFPLFVGGYLVGEELIEVLLNDKWLPIIPLFKYLCLAQIMTALNAINSYVHYAQGRPRWSLYFHLSLGILMAVSFYIAVNYGLHAILIPWFSTYMIICSIWIFITLNKIGLSPISYIKHLIHPIFATLTMAFVVSILQIIFNTYMMLNAQTTNLMAKLALEIATGATFYVLYLWIFDRQVFFELRKMWKS
jgi:O-antigen/teichoic acid export membrane protein